MDLYHASGSQGTPADTGMQMGQQLADNIRTAETRYAQPSVFANDSSQPKGNPDGSPDAPPSHYNYGAQLPVKYSTPTAEKDYMANKQEIRTAITSSGTPVVRTDPVTEKEVNYLESMKAQAELADFDLYVNSLIDPRKPGNLKWLMEIYPDFVERRIQQVHTDYEFALRNQMIDSWGINTFKDLHFKYMVDQNKIDGPRLAKHQSAADKYAPGWLSPYTWPMDTRDPNGVYLPFTSATFGAKPTNVADWQMQNITPLGKGRTTKAMAQAMYEVNPVVQLAPQLGTSGTRNYGAPLS